MSKRNRKRHKPDPLARDDLSVSTGPLASARIGYLAAFSPLELLCDAGACIIAGSEAKLRGYVTAYAPQLARRYTVQPVSSAELLTGIRAGLPYAFDEEAYNRFYPLAQRAGLGVGPEDFSQPPPPGVPGPAIHLVRVQHFRLR